MKAKITKNNKCVICGKRIDGYGHSAEPLKEGRCCDICNEEVILHRMRKAGLI